ncbi:hypothetical protein TSAR_003268, partial [Trichomalopsis sarcophagae]
KASSHVGEVIVGTDVKLLQDGHNQEIRPTQVAYKANSEDTCVQRLDLQSRDLADLNQLWVEHQKLKDPFLRRTGNPLRVEMYTKQALDAISNQKDIVLHLDATVRHEVGILKLDHMITCEYDTTSISNWLNDYKQFILNEKKNGHWQKL